MRGRKNSPPKLEGEVLSSRPDLFTNLLIFGEAAGFQFRINTFSVDADLETAAVGRYQYETFDLIFEFRDELFGQTDRFRFVVSNRAVDNLNLHSYFPCFVPSLIASHAFFNSRCWAVGCGFSLSCQRCS